MKIFWLYVLCPVCLLCLSSSTPAETIYPLGGNQIGFDYDLFYRTGVISGEISSLPPVGPYYFSPARKLNHGFESPSFRMLDINSPPDHYYFSPHSEIGDRMRLYTVSSETYRAVRDRHPDDLPSISGGFAYRPGNYFGAVTFFNLDRARAIDPDYTGKKYRGLAGDVETAALFFKKNKISLALGRVRVFWGPQRINLLLSETAEPLDLFSASFQTRLLSFNFLFARLDGSQPDAVDSLRYLERTFNDNRYLVGHRLDLNFHRRFRLGLFETVLYGGEGRPPELYYLNPLQFFHGAQLNEDEDDNTIVGIDFSYLPGRGTNIYGQLIVDDFQIDDKSQGDMEPNEIGFMLGLFKAGKIATLIPDLKIEYVRLTNRTYHQRDPRNRYLYRNKLLGHPLGPDADSLAVSARLWLDRIFYAEMELAYRRKGEGSIHKPWDEPWYLAAGDYHEPFPTGIVEKSLLTAVKAKGYLPFSRYTRNHLFMSLSAGWGKVDNYLNIDGRSQTLAWIDARISWLGWTDIKVD